MFLSATFPHFLSTPSRMVTPPPSWAASASASPLFQKKNNSYCPTWNYIHVRVPVVLPDMSRTLTHLQDWLMWYRIRAFLVEQLGCPKAPHMFYMAELNANEWNHPTYLWMSVPQRFILPFFFTESEEKKVQLDHIQVLCLILAEIFPQRSFFPHWLDRKLRCGGGPTPSGISKMEACNTWALFATSFKSWKLTSMFPF